jgi:site-specific DNA-methyltransferase (adenine-specific)
VSDEPLLILGDCREKLAGLPHVDSVVTDPPYGVELKEKTSRYSKTHKTESYTDDPEIVKNVVLPLLAAVREISSCVVVTCGIRRMMDYPQPDSIGTIFSPGAGGCDKWGFGCNNPILYYGKCPYLRARKGGRPNSFVSNAANPYRGSECKIEHPCPKPLVWMKWLVERASLPGQTVLDPFMGSGTTGVACILLGRKFIGIEKEPKYFAIAQKRIADALGRPVLGKKKEGLIW